MDNSISPISFKSNIKLVNPETYSNLLKGFPSALHEVDYPWTPNQILEGKRLYTQGVQDCIAGGIIYGNKARMFHQANWTEEAAKNHSQMVFDPEYFKLKLFEGIDLAKEKIHGFMLGGMIERDSQEGSFLKRIQAVFNDLSVPFTSLTRRKDVHYYGKYSLLYDSKSDTWCITNNLIDATSLAGIGKPKEILLKGKLVEYNIYAPPRDNYKITRKLTGVEDFFKSQFEDVNLSEFDKFV